jgi:sugar phosphate isomerase/epimerase
MFSFFHAYEKREIVMAYLQKMADVAKEYGVELYHENEKDIYGDTLERVQDIMRSVNGLKYIYDPANYLQCDEPAEKTIAALVDKTDYFHIKDVIVATGELVPAGYGDGHIDELVAVVRECEGCIPLKVLLLYRSTSDKDFNTLIAHATYVCSSITVKVWWNRYRILPKHI